METSNSQQKNHLNNSLNDSSGLFVFLLKKTEKLASAIYLMTNHLPDNEPLKRALRDKSSNLVSFMIGYKDLNGIQSYSFAKEAESKIIEIVSLLEVSQNIGLISKMNFSIVQEEFIRLIDLIKNSPAPDTQPVQSHSINQNYFNVGGYKAGNAVDSQGTLVSTASKISSSGGGSSNTKKSSRQNLVLSIVKKKGEVTIKDISEVIKNCSEKTIQRELNSLLASGVIKRIGERRWSKYSPV